MHRFVFLWQLCLSSSGISFLSSFFFLLYTLSWIYLSPWHIFVILGQEIFFSLAHICHPLAGRIFLSDMHPSSFCRIYFPVRQDIYFSLAYICHLLTRHIFLFGIYLSYFGRIYFSLWYLFILLWQDIFLPLAEYDFLSGIYLSSSDIFFSLVSGMYLSCFGRIYW